MNKTDIINAYSQLGIKDVTVYAMKGWDSNINPLTTIGPEQGVYNLTILEEAQFRRLLSSLHLTESYDNEMRNINCNIIITHQVDFCRFVGVYTYGQIPTKVHQFITDAGVNEINKLSKLQQGRIATFYLTLRNNPLFALVDKIVDYDGNTYDEVMSKIYDTYRVLNVEFESLFNLHYDDETVPHSAQQDVAEERLGGINQTGRTLPHEPEERIGGMNRNHVANVENSAEKIEPTQKMNQMEDFRVNNNMTRNEGLGALNSLNKLERTVQSGGLSAHAGGDDLELFRANLKQSILNRLDPIIDEVIENEISRFKLQIQDNILATIKNQLMS